MYAGHHKNLHPIDNLTILQNHHSPDQEGEHVKAVTTSGLTLYRASGRTIIDALACWLSGLLYPTADTGLFIICWLLEKNGYSRLLYTKTKDSSWSLGAKTSANSTPKYVSREQKLPRLHVQEEPSHQRQEDKTVSPRHPFPAQRGGFTHVFTLQTTDALSCTQLSKLAVENFL